MFFRGPFVVKAERREPARHGFGGVQGHINHETSLPWFLIFCKKMLALTALCVDGPGILVLRRGRA
jgi:hypothetical protein